MKIASNYKSGILTLITLLLMSCENDNASSNSDNKLINHVNAVQQQMMKQGNVSEEEKQAIKSLAELVSEPESKRDYNALDNAISLKSSEKAPVFPVCIEEDKLNDCFKNAVNDFINARFNSELKKKLISASESSVEYFFMVTKNGDIQNIKVRDTDVAIQGELVRVLKQLPNVIPGESKGEKVDILFEGILTFN